MHSHESSRAAMQYASAVEIFILYSYRRLDVLSCWILLDISVLFDSVMMVMLVMIMVMMMRMVVMMVVTMMVVLHGDFWNNNDCGFDGFVYGSYSDCNG